MIFRSAVCYCIGVGHSAGTDHMLHVLHNLRVVLHVLRVLLRVLCVLLRVLCELLRVLRVLHPP